MLKLIKSTIDIPTKLIMFARLILEKEKLIDANQKLIRDNYRLAHNLTTLLQVNLHQILPPDAVLRIIEQIPEMRNISEFKTFTHPKPKVIKLKSVSTTQPQRLTPNK